MTEEKKELETRFKAEAETNQAALNSMTQDRDELASKITELQAALDDHTSHSTTLDEEKARMSEEKKELELFVKAEAEMNKITLDSMTQERDSLKTDAEIMKTQILQKDVQLAQNAAELEEKSG